MFIADTWDWPTLVERLGLPLVLLIFVLFAGFKRWWVWGYQLRDCEKREREWKELALRGTLIAERTSGRSHWTTEQRLQYLEQLQEAQAQRKADDAQG